MPYFANFPKVLYSTSLGVKNYKLVSNILTKSVFRPEIFENSSIYYSYPVKDGERPEDIAAKLYGDANKHWIILISNNIVDPQYDWVLGNRAFNDYIIKKYSSTQFTLNPSETYSTNFTVGEKVYQGPSFDRASCYGDVIAYDSANKKLTLNFLSDVFANNTLMTGSSSNASHRPIASVRATDGFEWSSNTISHYMITEVTTNSYDKIKTEKTYRVSSKDYNMSSHAVVSRNINITTTNSYIIYGNITLTVQKTVAPVYYYDHEVALNEAKREIKLIKPEYVSRIESEFKRLMSS